MSYSKIIYLLAREKVNIPTEYGIMERFNDVYVYHNRFCIKKHCGTYINKLIKIHGWVDPGKKYVILIEHIQPASFKELQ